MREKNETKPTTKVATPPLGVNLEVLGRAIIAQADERIQWHKRTASRIETELKAIAKTSGAPASIADDWKLAERRSDLESKMDSHLEYARFLTFVRQNIVRDRRYRLALSDMSLLEIMPKGRYW
jgi:hypothetical protein